MIFIFDNSSKDSIYLIKITVFESSDDHIISPSDF